MADSKTKRKKPRRVTPKSPVLKEARLSKAAKILTPKQRLFCEFYASDREFFGNGVQSYMEAFDLPPAKYRSALALAGRLLGDSRILAYIDELLNVYVSEQVVDKELAFTIIQKQHLPAKVAAIKEYNSMKGRHAARKIQLVDELDEIPTEDIIDELARRRPDNRGSTKKPSTKKA